MVPSNYVWLDHFPLTPNGKLDKRALDIPEFQGKPISNVPPKNRIEKLLCSLYQDITGNKIVGPDDEFFKIGGNSLSAMRLINAIKQSLNIQLPLITIFSHPTPAKLGRLLENTSTFDFNPLLPLRTTGSKTPLFCIHPGGGVASAFINIANTLEPGRQVWGLQAKGLEDGESPHKDISEMAHSYIEFIRQIQESGPYLLLGWSQGGLIAHEIAKKLEDQGEHVGMVALMDTFTTSPHNLDSQDENISSYISTQLTALRDDITEDAMPNAYGDRLNLLHQVLIEHKFIPENTDIKWVEKMISQMMYAPKQIHQHVMRKINGQILLFQAADDNQNSSDPNSWVPYSSLPILNIPIDTTHMAMCQPLPAKEIASHLDKYLNLNKY